MKKSLQSLLLTLAALFVLTGCAVNVPSLTGSSYSRMEARQAYTVQTGTLESVRVVRLEGTQSGVGAIAGGLLGGLAGNKVGGGNGRKAMTILGVLAGAGLGAAAEERSTASQALELLVRLDSGQAMVIVQEISNEQLLLGQRVRVLNDGRTYRVTAA